MPSPTEVLRSLAVGVPGWLATFEPGGPFPRDEFFTSRVVYYPGSGTDGHPLKIFGGSHAAHCFVFSDYGTARETVEEQLRDADDPGHPRGYRPLHVEALSEQELRPGGWTQHIDTRRVDRGPATRKPEGGPYAVWAALERREGFGEDHGPSRLAVVVVGGEGVATFDALFCQGDAAPPYGVLLQDHGFGGNWTRFGGEDSPLWEIARLYARPEWLLVADNTHPWPGYACVSDGDTGGMHVRRLWFGGL